MNGVEQPCKSCDCLVNIMLRMKKTDIFLGGFLRLGLVFGYIFGKMGPGDIFGICFGCCLLAFGQILLALWGRKALALVDFGAAEWTIEHWGCVKAMTPLRLAQW